MKVESKKSFEPVTITLESQLEVDAMYVIISKVAQGDSGFDTPNLYTKLKALASHVDEPLLRAEAPTHYGIGLMLKKRFA